MNAFLNWFAFVGAIFNLALTVGLEMQSRHDKQVHATYKSGYDAGREDGDKLSKLANDPR